MNYFIQVWQSKLNITHFLVSLVITCLLAYDIFVLSVLFTWLCCMDFFESFSWLTILSIFTTVLLILLSIMYIFYYYAKRKKKLSFCKSYLILTAILISAYFIITSWVIIVN